MTFQRIVVALLVLIVAGLGAIGYFEWKMAVQVRTLKAFVEGYVFNEAVIACEQAKSSTPFKWNGGKSTAVIGLNSVKTDKYTVSASYTLVADSVYCDYDPIKRKAEIGSSFLEAGVTIRPCQAWDGIVMAQGQGDYRILHEAALRDYLAGVADLAATLGGEPASWSITEVGDGNLNLVFIVKGGRGGIAVKQALPYVRLVGESWPLPLSRAHYEYLALSRQAELAPGLVPALLHHNEALALTVMELLEPHIIMRKGMVAGSQYPRFVDDITTFMARTLFFTSDLAVSAAEKKQGIAAFAGNHALCKITEDLIFTDPYRVAEQNRWTAPYLDALAAELREDMDLHVAISRLKLKFMASPEALLHGDLHTGSIMVTGGETRVIDPEFAFYGPMGFDVGAVLANLLMAYFASAGHERTPGERRAFEAWVLETVETVWNDFTRKFLELWRAGAAGDAYPASLFAGETGAARLEAERQAYMQRLFADTVGFAAAKTIRRIFGLAHNIDFELIEDPRRRAISEARAVRLARAMMLEVGAFPTIADVTAAARKLRDWQPEF
ncbi:5-methylthioribose kinase [Bradyrhizobium sp. GM5.1]